MNLKGLKIVIHIFKATNHIQKFWKSDFIWNHKILAFEKVWFWRVP